MVIRKKLEDDDTFTTEHLLTVDLEPQNKHSELLGFYDIKIRSSLWNSYFTFECKCVNSTQASIFEYVHNPHKVKQKRKFEDGGLYRFLINKYAKDKRFGGMAGFLQKGDLSQAKNLIYAQIKTLKLVCSPACFGALSEEGILEEADIPYYFQTNHSRFDISEKRECAPVKIHHFLYDFTK